MEGWVPGEAELKKALAALFSQKPPPSVSKIDPICHIAINYVKVSSILFPLPSLTSIQYYKHVVHHIIKYARNTPPEVRLSLL